MNPNYFVFFLSVKNLVLLIGLFFVCCRWYLRSSSNSIRSTLRRRREPTVQRPRQRLNLNRPNGNNFAAQSPTATTVHNIREDTPSSYEEATSTTSLLPKG